MHDGDGDDADNKDGDYDHGSDDDEDDEGDFSHTPCGRAQRECTKETQIPGTISKKREQGF